ncbi:MAG TPA: cell division protein FtsQ/DivIB, partial [Elusimicrobiales bacterium]|nr:cell division protein FtsQ/DivIB [Elusimicrobiales bacterium]
RLLQAARPPDAAPGEERYLAEDGRLLTENYGPEPADIFGVELRSGEGLARLAVFLKEFSPLSSGLLSRPVKLEYPSPGSGRESTCRLELANGASVLWGDFEFTEAKVSRLNEVLADASGRVKGPLRVDMRYFGDGKVFVSKAGDI